MYQRYQSINKYPQPQLFLAFHHYFHCEHDYVGWDLEAVRDKKLLRIEVKGLSGSEVAVELTPNEYSKMAQYKHSYRVCVVTQCLTDNPKLHVFSYSPESGEWEDDHGRRLERQEIISAKLKLIK